MAIIKQLTDNQDDVKIFPVTDEKAVIARGTTLYEHLNTLVTNSEVEAFINDSENKLQNNINLLQDYCDETFLTKDSINIDFDKYITDDEINIILSDYLPNSGGVVNGNITANSLSVNSPSLLSYIEGDFPFKDVLKFVWSYDDGDGIKLSVPGYHDADVFLHLSVGRGAVFSHTVTAQKFIGALEGTADNATKLTAIGLPPESMDRGTISYSRFDNNENVVGLPTTDNDNGILTINTHEGPYNHQLGFSTSGFFYRKVYDKGSNTSGDWNTILHSGNYSDYALPMTSYAYELNPNEILDSRTARIYPHVQIFTEDNVGSYRKGLLRLSGGGSESQLLFDHASGTMMYRQIGDIINHEGWREVVFTDTDSLTPSSGILTVNGNLLSTGEVTVNGGIQLNGTIHFTEDAPMIKMLEDGWGQSKVMWHSWDSTEGDSLWLQIPSGVENDVYFKLCRLAPSILNTSLQVNGNITASDSFNVGKTNGVLFSIVADYQNWQNVDIISKLWDDSRWDYVKITTPTTYSRNSSINICARGYVEVIGNFVTTGDITVRNVIASGSIVGGKPLHEFNESAISIDPNIYYRLTSAQASLTISLNSPSNTNIMNEYFIEFPCGGSVTLPTLTWVNGTAPTFESGKTYQISIVNNLALCASFS